VKFDQRASAQLCKLVVAVRGWRFFLNRVWGLLARLLTIAHESCLLSNIMGVLNTALERQLSSR
jgi:hypothetical protein